MILIPRQSVATCARWALVVAAAAAAGAAVAISPLFLAVEAVLLCVLAALAYPRSPWQFMALATIVISPSIFLAADGNPVPNGDAAQKMILLVAALCLAVTLGLRWSGVGAAAVAVIGLAGLVSILDIGGGIDTPPGLVARAMVGYCLPWLFLFVNWRGMPLARGLQFLARLPLLCVAAGVPLQLAGITTVFRVEATGVPRLQGASIPAHLAMLALIALAAGLCVLAAPGGDRVPRTYLWVGVNLAILFGTATRGPLVVAAMLVFAYVLYALTHARALSARARRAVWVIVGIGVAAGSMAAPELIRRSMGNSYEGAFNTSGRDQAWEFFYGLASQSPFTGKGLGFSTIAVELYVPAHVQKEFVAPHNEYIHLTLDGGLFFGIGLGLVMLAAFVLAARAQRGAIRWVIVAFAIGTVFYSYFDNTFSTPQFTLLLVILLSLLAAHPQTGSPPDEAAPDTPSARTLTTTAAR